MNWYSEEDIKKWNLDDKIQKEYYEKIIKSIKEKKNEKKVLKEMEEFLNYSSEYYVF